MARISPVWGSTASRAPSTSGCWSSSSRLGTAVVAGRLDQEQRRRPVAEDGAHALAGPGEGGIGHGQHGLADPHLGSVRAPGQDDAAHRIAVLEEAVPAGQRGRFRIGDELHAVLAEAPAPVDIAQPGAHRRVGRALPDRIDGGGHFQAAFQHPVPAVLVVEILAHLLHRIGGDRVLLGVLPGQADGTVLQRDGVAVLEVALGRHAPEHVVAALLGGRPGPRIGVIGVVSVRVLDQPGEHGAILHRQLGRALAEVVLGGGFDAVAAAAEIHLVGVLLEDLLLGVGLLQPQGEDDLLELAVQAALALGGHRAHQLHGEGGGAFPAPAEAGHEVESRRARPPGPRCHGGS